MHISHRANLLLCFGRYSLYNQTALHHFCSEYKTLTMLAHQMITQILNFSFSEQYRICHPLLCASLWGDDLEIKQKKQLNLSIAKISNESMVIFDALISLSYIYLNKEEMLNRIGGF